MKRYEPFPDNSAPEGWPKEYVAATDYDALAASLLIERGKLEKADTENDRLSARVASMQARIDSLMIEFCPGEMSQEQRDEWARNQVRSPDA